MKLSISQNENISLGMREDHIIIASHRRSGTQLTIDLILNNFDIYSNAKPYLSLAGLQKNIHKKEFENQFISNLKDKPRVIKSHAHANHSDYYSNNETILHIANYLFKNCKIIYVYRDGRDVLNSLYYYYNKLYPERNAINFSQFINMKNDLDDDTFSKNLNRVEYWYYHLNGWLQKNNILFLSYEQILKDYYGCFLKIREYLAINPNSKIIDVRISQHSTQSNNKAKHTSILYRKGLIGDYQNIFSREDYNVFEKYTNNLLNKLGYN
ncbi:MAG: sulfotransferase domain-containing protein [Bacteroidales bacterium]|nr:MAG: sulfotransferase domain-containing protein [Bacteroidales bacterium]